MQYKWDTGRPTCDLIGKNLDVFAPVFKTHFLENTGALTDTAIIVPKDFNMPRGQISGPTNPCVV
jgi:hypothetical protein